MTICIAAHGHEAGKAVLNALAAIEAVASGAVGGFVSAVALEDRFCFRAETQDGGTRQLRFEQSSTLFEQASLAGLISSGPNRPPPLIDFLPAMAGVGLVTGHRSPSVRDRSGEPLNRQILQRLQSGQAPRDAVEEILCINPDADAGFIAMTCNGDAYAGNTRLVLKRPDIGKACARRGSASIVVMHNAITPVYPMAELAVQIALETLCPAHATIKFIVLQKGCKVIHGARSSIRINDDNHVEQVVVSHPLSDDQAVLDLGYQADVCCHDRLVGVLLHEPYLLVSNGRLDSANGQSLITLSVGC